MNYCDGNNNISVITEFSQGSLHLHLIKLGEKNLYMGKIIIGNLPCDKLDVSQNYSCGITECVFDGMSIKFFISLNNCLYISITADKNVVMPTFNISINKYDKSSIFEYSENGLEWYLSKSNNSNYKSFSVCCRRLSAIDNCGVKSTEFCISVISESESVNYVSKGIQLVVDSDFENELKSTGVRYKNFLSLSNMIIGDKYIDRLYNKSIYFLNSVMVENSDFQCIDNVFSMLSLLTSNRYEYADTIICKCNNFTDKNNCKVVDVVNNNICKGFNLDKNTICFSCLLVAYWHCTYEIDFGKTVVYPYIKALCLDLEKHLTKTNDKYVVDNYIIENFIKIVFSCLIDIANTVNVDEKKIVKWMDIVDCTVSKKSISTLLKSRNKKNSNALNEIELILSVSLLDKNSSYFNLCKINSKTKLYKKRLFSEISKCDEKFEIESIIKNSNILTSNSLIAVPFFLNYSLVSCHNGVVNLFPYWDLKYDVSFENISVLGGFLFSGTLESGKIIKLTVKSIKGNVCHVKCPNSSISVKRIDGSSICCKKCGSYIEFDTNINEVYVLI